MKKNKLFIYFLLIFLPNIGCGRKKIEEKSTEQPLLSGCRNIQLIFATLYGDGGGYPGIANVAYDFILTNDSNDTMEISGNLLWNAQGEKADTIQLTEIKIAPNSALAKHLNLTLPLGYTLDKDGEKEMLFPSFEFIDSNQNCEIKYHHHFKSYLFKNGLEQNELRPKELDSLINF